MSIQVKNKKDQKHKTQKQNSLPKTICSEYPVKD